MLSNKWELPSKLVIGLPARLKPSACFIIRHTAEDHDMLHAHRLSIGRSKTEFSPSFKMSHQKIATGPARGLAVLTETPSRVQEDAHPYKNPYQDHVRQG